MATPLSRGPALVATNGCVKVLLVDDDARNLEVLESILAAPGLQLVRAQTPEAALLALVNDEFACIVLDVQMPGMSGLDLASLIKTRKRCSHIPIVFLTAYFHSDQEILQGYGVGAVDFLTKPLNPQILKSKVGVLVDLFTTNRRLVAMNSALEQEIAQRQKAEEALSQANSELATISEREQQRIGQDLHDGLCQYLTGLKFKSSLLEQKLAKLGLTEADDARCIEALLNQAIEHARHLARGLNPIRLEADGLVLALRDLAAGVASLFSVQCSCAAPSGILSVDHPRAIHLFRIAQEATSNAIKHGKATHIDLRLVQRADWLELTIADNGSGMATGTQANRGTGLHIMHYRARTIGATLDVKSGPCGGVVVTCTLPSAASSSPPR